MGSKNRVALDLFREMLKIKPKAKYFIDLFGGGGAMSFTALQLGLNVTYNELQSDLVNFIRYILDRVKTGQRGNYGLFPDEFYKFITREDFKRLRTESTQLAQFARICYSFGNNQKNYLFCEDIEKTKHLAHNIVVFQCQESLKEFNALTESNVKINDLHGWNNRRLDFQAQIRVARNLAELERLEQLQRLEQLEQLERLHNIKLLNLDYKDVLINTPPEETIVYLDPPYRGTAGYIEGAIHSEIDTYFKSLPYTAFMSEYNAPFRSIFEIKKTKLLNNSAAKKTKALEKLYINN